VMRFACDFDFLRALRREQGGQEQKQGAAFHGGDCTSSEKLKGMP
jgi:hypothetical protein